MEAMASGCAVIASRRGGLPEACVGAGLLVEPDDFQEVVSVLRSLVTDRNLLRSEKQKSVERASREPWSNCADVVEKLIPNGAPTSAVPARGERPPRVAAKSVR
jgi:glycosyltransferase involved in cell wall biosynthesis